MSSAFNPQNADDIFAEYFGVSSSFGGKGGGGGGGGSEGGSFSQGIRKAAPIENADDLFAEYFGVSSSFGGKGGGGGGGGGSEGGSFSQGIRKAAPIENYLPCSLEELYNGTTKKMKISREIANVSGKTMTVEEIITIDIKPGWKKGTKITFPEKGNEQPNVVPADLVFIIDEKPHSLFTRDGNDLVVTQMISLADALTGYTVHLTTLDGRSLTIPIDNVIHPTYEEVVPRKGMPIPKDPTKRGNLRIKFNINPTRLTAEQKAGIKKLLVT